VASWRPLSPRPNEIRYGTLDPRCDHPRTLVTLGGVAATRTCWSRGAYFRRRGGRNGAMPKQQRDVFPERPAPHLRQDRVARQWASGPPSGSNSGSNRGTRGGLAGPFEQSFPLESRSPRTVADALDRTAKPLFTGSNPVVASTFPPCIQNHSPRILPRARFKDSTRQLLLLGEARGVDSACGNVSTARRSGGTGRRGGLKIRCPRGRQGSSPCFGTSLLVFRLSDFKRDHVLRLTPRPSPYPPS
jgi:hypothetical protein